MSFLFERAFVIYVLIVFVSSFSFFLSPVLAESHQSSIDAERLEEMSEVLETKFLTNGKQNSQSASIENLLPAFEIISPPP